jgi:hypothetical protein
MLEQNEGMQESTPETAPPMPVVQDKQAEIDAYELEMFKKGFAASGEQLPQNYASIDDMYKSFKNLQKGYTQARQEIAELKKTVQEPSAPKEEIKETVDNPPVGDVLKIEPPKEPPPVAVQESQKLTADLWAKWNREIDSSGTISEETKNEMRRFINADEAVISDFVNQRKAAIKLARDESEAVVGGKENLKEILLWAGKNLSKEEQDAANKALQSPAYKVTLLGLKARYESSTRQEPVVSKMASEPSSPMPKNVLNVPDAPKQQIMPFSTQGEMLAYIGDPRYKTDPGFRAMVAERLVLTQQQGKIIRS